MIWCIEPGLSVIEHDIYQIQLQILTTVNGILFLFKLPVFVVYIKSTRIIFLFQHPKKSLPADYKTNNTEWMMNAHSCGVILLLVHRLNFNFQLYSSVNQNMQSLLPTLLHASGFMSERERERERQRERQTETDRVFLHNKQNDKQINSEKTG